MNRVNIDILGKGIENRFEQLEKRGNKNSDDNDSQYEKRQHHNKVKNANAVTDGLEHKQQGSKIKKKNNATLPGISPPTKNTWHARYELHYQD